MTTECLLLLKYLSGVPLMVTLIFFDGMFMKVHERLMTPQELYGVLDPQTRDWTDGSRPRGLRGRLRH